MHSSEMRTALLLTVSRSIWGWGEGVCPEGVLPRDVEGCLPRGVSPRDLPSGRLPWGVSQHAMEQTPLPPWKESQTDLCKNITLPQTSFADGNDNVGFQVQWIDKISILLKIRMVKLFKYLHIILIVKK